MTDQIDWTQKALDVINGAEIQENKDKLGMIGCQDIERIQWMLEQAIKQQTEETENGTIDRQ